MTTKSPPAAWPPPPIDYDKLRERLAHGARLRTGIMEQIARGEEPAPAYRVEWLRQTAKEIVLVVARSGEAFNASHREDGFSLADALDAVATARTMLLAMSKTGGG
jgi:hypothetical protein